MDIDITFPITIAVSFALTLPECESPIESPSDEGSESELGADTASLKNRERQTSIHTDVPVPSGYDKQQNKTLPEEPRCFDDLYQGVPSSIATFLLAQKWASNQPIAIAGKDGSIQTRRVLTSLLRDYKLSPGTIPFAVDEWNQRCLPPWSMIGLLKEIDLCSRSMSVSASEPE